MKIGVNSASGQLGAAIVRVLIQHHPQHEVVALARTTSKVNIEDIKVRQADYTDRSGLEKAFAGLDAILLVSANGDPEPRKQMHLNVIEAAKSAGVKKLVYTSIMGAPEGSGFSPIVASNRHTERDLRASGLEWSIGRNGIYIEPDIEYLEEYQKAGCIRNCAGEGRCGYTTRDELAYAYANLLVNPASNGQVFNLSGPAITQQELTDYMNACFGTSLIFESMSFEDYLAERTEALGPFLGDVIAGIYQAIALGHFEQEPHYEAAAGRPHISWEAYFEGLKDG